MNNIKFAYIISLWSITCFIIGLLAGICLAKPLSPYDKGMQDGMLKGISVSYKTFRQMFNDKKHRQEYLKRLVAEIQAQKVYEAKIK